MVVSSAMIGSCFPVFSLTKKDFIVMQVLPLVVEPSSRNFEPCLLHEALVLAVTLCYEHSAALSQNAVGTHGESRDLAAVWNVPAECGFVLKCEECHLLRFGGDCNVWGHQGLSCHRHTCFHIIHVCVSGNHILPDEDLASFHWSLLGPEHPLASLKVWTSAPFQHCYYYLSKVYFVLY